MASELFDNFRMNSDLPNFERDLFDTVDDMVAFSEDYLPDVFECNTKDGKRYRFNRSNDVDPILGKWRLVEGNGGASIEDWTIGKGYSENDLVIYNSILYKCTTSPQADNTVFNVNEWEVIGSGDLKTKTIESTSFTLVNSNYEYEFDNPFKSKNIICSLQKTNGSVMLDSIIVTDNKIKVILSTPETVLINIIGASLNNQQEIYFTTTSPVTNKIGEFDLGEEVTEADKITLNEALNRILHLNNDPTATLEVTKLNNLMETGQSVQNPKLRLVFTGLGNGTITNIQFLKNGVEINNQPFMVGTTEYTYDDVNTITNDTTYKAVITYNFGKGDKTLVKTFTSKFVRKSFYGTTNQDTFDLTSDNIRNLSGGLLGVKKGDKFNLNISAGSKEVIFAYPSDLGDMSDVIYVEGMNSSIKGVFTKQVVNVNDYNGSPASYNVYTYRPDLVYTQDVTYIVTI